jgi:DNA-binding MarR family transcriptional regulator
MTRSIDLFTELVRAQIELWDALDAHLKSTIGITLARFQALSAVGDIDGPARVQEISEQMRITVGAASKLVDRLERDGLVARSAHPTDRRSSIVALTDLGTSTLASANEIADAHLSTTFGTAMTDDTADRFFDVLTSLRAHSRAETAL